METKPLALAACFSLIAGGVMAQTKYDLLLRGGHVIDARSGTTASHKRHAQFLAYFTDCCGAESQYFLTGAGL